MEWKSQFPGRSAWGVGRQPVYNIASQGLSSDDDDDEEDHINGVDGDDDIDDGDDGDDLSKGEGEGQGADEGGRALQKRGEGDFFLLTHPKRSSSSSLGIWR